MLVINKLKLTQMEALIKTLPHVSALSKANDAAYEKVIHIGEYSNTSITVLNMAPKQKMLTNY